MDFDDILTGGILGGIFGDDEEERRKKKRLSDSEEEAVRERDKKRYESLKEKRVDVPVPAKKEIDPVYVAAPHVQAPLQLSSDSYPTLHLNDFPTLDVGGMETLQIPPSRLDEVLKDQADRLKAGAPDKTTVERSLDAMLEDQKDNWDFIQRMLKKQE